MQVQAHLPCQEKVVQDVALARHEVLLADLEGNALCIEEGALEIPLQKKRILGPIVFQGSVLNRVLGKLTTVQHDGDGTKGIPVEIQGDHDIGLVEGPARWLFPEARIPGQVLFYPKSLPKV